MEDLKRAKGGTFAAIAYHMSDGFDAGMGRVRYAYYGRPEYQNGIPLSIINGSFHRFGGMLPGGSLFGEFLELYNEAAGIPTGVDITLSMDGSNRVRAEVSNPSASPIQGTLHIVLVERHRPYAWRNLETVDFVCRSMLPTPHGQQMTIGPGQRSSSVQSFYVQPDWNYCSIVAFFQTEDHAVAQTAVMEILDSVPIIELQGAPEAGDLWLKGSTHSFSWSSSRPLSSVVVEYSSDGGLSWNAINPASAGGNTYNWTVPAIDSSQCFLAARDPYGGARSISGIFAIGSEGGQGPDPGLRLLEGPQTGDLWLKDSRHSISWSSILPLSSVMMEYSCDGGKAWTTIKQVSGEGNTYRWTMPEINAIRCFLAVRDPASGTRAVSGLFAIGLRGDFNADGRVDGLDRSILVDYVTENRAALIPGTDLNGDGKVDLFDLISFDADFGE